MKRLLIPLFCLFASAAWGQNPAPAAITEAEREVLLDRAKSLKAEADRIRTEAEKRHAEADSACWKKTLVSGCQADARRAYVDSTAAARKLEVEAKKIEREVRERSRAPPGW